MVAVKYSTLSPSTWIKLGSTVVNGEIRYRGVNDINNILAEFHGCLTPNSTEMGDNAYYIEFESEKYMTLFFLKYG